MNELISHQHKRITRNGYPHIMDAFQIIPVSPNAIPPSKERDSDVCWDIHLIGRTENRTEDLMNDVNYFCTGWRLEAPIGFHFEIVARSTLHKAGYQLVNSPVIIDPENTNEILVPLLKIKDVEDLEIPFSGVQLILRETIYSNPQPIEAKKEPSSKGTKSSASRNASYMPTFDDETKLPTTKKGKGKSNNLF